MRVDFGKINTDNNKENNFDWTNIHSNFNEELVQEWQRHGFTYGQCADWINISYLNEQEQVIEEPVYYAWLRDEVKMTPEQVLNKSDEAELRELFQEYQQSQQEQYQAQILVVPHSRDN